MSSYLSWLHARDLPPRLAGAARTTTWWIAALNLIGSVFFGLAAIAAFTLPSTDDLLDASIAEQRHVARGGVLLWGAASMLLPPALGASTEMAQADQPGGQASHGRRLDATGVDRFPEPPEVLEVLRRSSLGEAVIATSRRSLCYRCRR